MLIHSLKICMKIKKNCHSGHNVDLGGTKSIRVFYLLRQSFIYVYRIRQFTKFNTTLLLCHGIA